MPDKVVHDIEIAQERAGLAGNLNLDKLLSSWFLLKLKRNQICRLQVGSRFNRLWIGLIIVECGTHKKNC
jgi:hypothetical protein